MHETSEYHRYNHLCNFESNTLIYFLFNSKHNIYYIIHNFAKIYLHIKENNQSKCK